MFKEMFKKDATEQEEKEVRAEFSSIPHYRRPAMLDDHVVLLSICSGMGRVLMAIFCCIPFILFFNEQYQGEALFPVFGAAVFSCIGFLLSKRFRETCLSMNTQLSRYGLILQSQNPDKEKS